jgi:site-specific DNA-methyltransferase (cytosine-N4-specific)
MNTLLVRMKPYIQPFERILALRELEVIADAKPRALGLLDETSTDFEIKSTCTQNDLVRRLAYWETVKQEKHLIITG